LQQFVNQTVWDEQVVLQTCRRVMGEALTIRKALSSSTTPVLPRRAATRWVWRAQYSGTLGKTDNWQVAASLHYAAPKGDHPLAWRLYLPESWTSQLQRMDAARTAAASNAKNQE
jgi:SRSO17 transposase